MDEPVWLEANGLMIIQYFDVAITFILILFVFSY